MKDILTRSVLIFVYVFCLGSSISSAEKLKDGRHQNNFKSGQIKRVWHIKNGRMDGDEIVYRQNGLIHKEKKYKNGRLSGIQKDYWINGNRAMFAHYVNGTKHGEFTIYSPDGQLVKTNHYKKGRLVEGTYENEGVKEMLDKIREKRNNKEKWEKKNFIDTKDLKSISTGENEVFTGMLKDYFEHGGVKNVTNYLDGLRDGIQINYYDTGELASRFFFVSGDLEGIQEMFYKNGVLRARENYRQGEMDGEQEYFSGGGVLMVRKVFTMGNMVRHQRFEYKDGVFRTVSQLIERQQESRNDDADLEIATSEKPDLYEGIVETSSQLFYDNGNLKVDLETRRGPKVIEKIYYEDGELQYEVEWSGGDFLYFAEYSQEGELVQQEFDSIYKMAGLIQHKDFCDILKGKDEADNCILFPTDSNKKCIDSSECQAYCIVFDVEDQGVEIEGTCSAQSDNIEGCYRHLSNGFTTQKRGQCT